MRDPTTVSPHEIGLPAQRCHCCKPADKTMGTTCRLSLDSSLNLPASSFTELGYEPALEQDRETRLTVSNGLIGIRGALDIPTTASHPLLLLAGLFDQTAVDAVPGLVPVPGWPQAHVTVDGEPLSCKCGEILSLMRSLDLAHGLLRTQWQHRTPGRQEIYLHSLRLTSQVQRALALTILQVEVTRPAEVTCTFAPPPIPPPLWCTFVTDKVQLWETVQTGLAAAVASAVRVLHPRPTHLLHATPTSWRWQAHPGVPVTLASFVTIARGAVDAPLVDQVSQILATAQRHGAHQVLSAHARAWQRQWARGHITVQGDPESQRACDFLHYHLLSAANPQEEHLSIGARGLTGDAYQGHVFWDTESFLVPYYLFTWPEAARALLRYRWHTLPAARAKAVLHGYHGAWYAWEATDTGEEATPSGVRLPTGQIVPIRCAEQEVHISADMGLAAWRYWLATGDAAFLCTAGAPILLETARFWASRVSRDQEGQYHLLQVIGPDEYHERVDDNAYTNAMARWNLLCGVTVARIAQRRWPEQWQTLQAQVALTAAELVLWHDIAERLVIREDPGTGGIEQFAGYFHLTPVELTGRHPHLPPPNIVWGAEHVQQTQIIKQADVLMLLATFRECFTPAVCETNLRYYEPRCAHGSSLSPPIHALVAAHIGDLSLAMQYLREAMAIDLTDTMGNAAQGIHLATLGGIWQAIIYGFVGLMVNQEGVHLDPHLPPDWHELSLPLQWQRRQLWITLRHTPRRITITLRQGSALILWLGNERRHLNRYATHTWEWSEADHHWKEIPSMTPMSPPVLVALDGSPAASMAVPIAQVVAQQLSARLQIVMVAEQTTCIHQMREQLPLATWGIPEQDLILVTGDPATEMLRLTTRSDTPLVVLTTHGGGLQPNTRLGHIAEHVIARVTRPLLVVRPEVAQTAPTPLHHILLPLDGMPSTSAALFTIMPLLGRLGATLGLLYVADPAQSPPTERGSFGAPRYVDYPQHDWDAWMQAVVDRVRACCHLGQTTMPIRSFLSMGDVGAEIATFAHQRHVDAVILIRRSQLEPHRAHILRGVLSSTPCPVFITGTAEAEAITSPMEEYP